MRFQSAAISRRDFGVLETCDTKLVLELVLPSSLKLRVRRVCCQPAEITGFPPDFNNAGNFYPILAKSRLENSLQRVRSTLPLQNRRKIPAQAEAEDIQKLKIAWRLCYSRKPFRELCPRMRTPEKGSDGGLLNLMPRAPARIQRITQTLLHLSST